MKKHRLFYSRRNNKQSRYKAKKWEFEVEVMVDEKCPRCGNDTIELGTPIIKVGKTREMRVAVRQCKNCALIFYEGIKE